MNNSECPCKNLAGRKRKTSTFRMLIAIRFTLAVDILLIRKGAGQEKWQNIAECQRYKWYTVYHFGKHTCDTKQNTKKYKRFVWQAVVNRSVGIWCIQQTTGGEAIEAGNISEAERRALQLSYRQTKSKEATLAHDRNSNKHLLQAVGFFKRWLVRMTNISFIKFIIPCSTMTKIMSLRLVKIW